MTNETYNVILNVTSKEQQTKKKRMIKMEQFKVKTIITESETTNLDDISFNEAMGLLLDYGTYTTDEGKEIYYVTVKA